MRTQRSKVFGFIGDDIATTPFAGQIIQGAQEAALRREMLLLTFNTGGSSKLENAAVQMALERGVEGIIFAAMYHRSVRVPKDAFRLPLVLVDCFAPKSPVPSVVPDEFQGGYLATKLLLEKGHRRIAMINAGRKYPAAVGRLGGYPSCPRRI
jgi:LacI family transcriptional regulator